jgi:hypothetical protein
MHAASVYNASATRAAAARVVMAMLEPGALPISVSRHNYVSSGLVVGTVGWRCHAADVIGTILPHVGAVLPRGTRSPR